MIATWRVLDYVMEHVSSDESAEAEGWVFICPGCSREILPTQYEGECAECGCECEAVKR